MYNDSLKVFIAKIPEIIEFKPIYPESRWNEIIDCKSEEVKEQKYTVWKLLKWVVEKQYNLQFKDIVFSKSANGKWLADKIYFSLSHTDDFVAVCVDNQPIGLDIEVLDECTMTKSLFRYTTTDKEKTKYISPSAVDIATLWTKKEAIFKYLNKDLFVPSKIETEDYVTSSTVFNKFNVIISVCGKDVPLEIITVNLA